MSVFRFSLRWLLVLVAFIAVGLASLRNASVLISGGLAIAWLLFLTVTVLGVVYGRDGRRTFWLGCCIFGWAFAAHAYLFQGKDTALDRAIRSIYEHVSWKAAVDRKTGEDYEASGARVSYGKGVANVQLPAREPFEAALRVLVGIAASVAVGAIAQWFHSAQSRTGDRDKHR